MTCSCSGAMTQAGDLPGIVAQAAGKAERQVRRGFRFLGFKNVQGWDWGLGLGQVALLCGDGWCA